MDIESNSVPAVVRSIRVTGSLAAVLSILGCDARAEPSKPATTRRTEALRVEGGLIEGAQLDGGVLAFKGIPFAAPPLGDLRWKPPQRVTPWTGVRQCISYGPVCPQPAKTKFTFGEYKDISEDCLYLNVWIPAKSADEKLPVMVWFHGGGFIAGSASDDFYNGQDLARKGVLVVTTNYRIGPLGFLAHPLLSKESAGGVSGNYGVLDQIAALKWVQENISAFGGDPGRVTIFGQSAGGRSVALLMVSPLSSGLFHRAIMQSSSVYRPIQHLRESWYGRPSMEQVGIEVAQKLGCDGAADPISQMRSRTADEILDAAAPRLPGMGLRETSAEEEGFPFEPIVDGWVIPDDPSDLFDEGKLHKVPVIAGSNADEGTLFLARMRRIAPDRARQMLEVAFPRHSNEVAKLYPLKTAQDARDALNHASGDMNCTYPMRSIVRSVRRAGPNAWLYLFTRVRSDWLGRELGAWHGSEIRFVFNSLDRGRSRVESLDRQLANTMSGYWVQFAATGDPNGPGLPKWPVYSAEQEHYLELGDVVTAKQQCHTKSCDLFEKIEKERRRDRRR